MPQWTTFAAVTGVVLVVLLVLTYLTQRAFEEGVAPPARNADADGPGDDAAAGSRKPAERASSSPRESTAPPSRDRSREDSGERPDRIPVDAGVLDDADGERVARDVDRRSLDAGPSTDAGSSTDATADRRGAAADDPADLSTLAVLANVALSQGLFAVALVGAAIYADIPASSFGVAFDAGFLWTGLAVGTVLGVALYVANEVGATAAERGGLDRDESLRELLAPEAAGGWAVLLGVVLPIVAIFEELLFRAALIGVLAAGFGIDPWLLVVASSVAFSLGHGMQGRVGIVVTGALGLALGAAFVLTGNLFVVIVAHYLVNALEFVVHEGFGIEWTGTHGS